MEVAENSGGKKKGRSQSKSQGKAKERKCYDCGQLGYSLVTTIRRKQNKKEKAKVRLL